MVSFPNALRVFLVGLTILSYVPQYKRILGRGDSAGISQIYILINLIVATQQFSLYLLLVIDDSTVSDFLVKSPPSIENYLDLAQFGTVWLCQLIIFILCLAYRPLTQSRKWPVILHYMLFLFITLIPVVWMWTLPPSSTRDFYHNRNGPVVFYQWLHIGHVNYIATIVAFIASIPQIRQLRTRSDPGALSIFGLGGQAFLFALVAISWSLRLQYVTSYKRTVWKWYKWVGWATLDNAALAMTQMVIWWIASQLKPLEVGENAPLLV